MAGFSHIKAVMIIVGSLLLILLFHGAVSLAGPALFSIPYDPALPDGKMVVYSGTVEDIRRTWSGGHMVADLSGVKLYIPRGVDAPSLRIGDQLTAYGLLSTYDGQREIVIRAGSDLILH